MNAQRSLLRRIGYAASFLAVAGVAAYVSYGHIYEVATVAHQPRLLALALPLSVDGLMLFATIAISEDKAANREPRAWARFGFWLGAAASVAANVASTLVHFGPKPLDLAVAGWAPIALLVLVEIVARPGKPKAAEAVSPVVEQQPIVVAEPAPVASVTPQSKPSVRESRTRRTRTAAAASKATPTKPWPVRADGTTANDPVRDQA